MEKLKSGFYTALGTPLDKDGNIVGASLTKEINMQIDAGASGLLLMGSMGMEASVPDKAFVEAVRVASEATAKRVPLFVGAMDNSVKRVLERIEAIKDFDFDAVVLTTPFYFASGEAELVKFFEMIADSSPKPVFLYDLPVVTKCKITYSMLQKLSKHKNIKGIKSGDILLAKQVKRNLPEFEFLYSNIDCFDIAISYGIDKVLDGMFSCTPVNGRKFVESVRKGNIAEAGDYLQNILDLRDTFVKYGVFPSFVAAMNMLGMEGTFAPDYMGCVEGSEAQAVEKAMKEINEL